MCIIIIIGEKYVFKAEGECELQIIMLLSVLLFSLSLWVCLGQPHLGSGIIILGSISRVCFSGQLLTVSGSLTFQQRLFLHIPIQIFTC